MASRGPDCYGSKSSRNKRSLGKNAVLMSFVPGKFPAGGSLPHAPNRATELPRLCSSYHDRDSGSAGGGAGRPASEPEPEEPEPEPEPEPDRDSQPPSQPEPASEPAGLGGARAGGPEPAACQPE
eukprot:3697617-Rhodomonas_salina.5